jgi:transcriptional regulator with XRE-family HTH domain
MINDSASQTRKRRGRSSKAQKTANETEQQSNSPEPAITWSGEYKKQVQLAASPSQSISQASLNEKKEKQISPISDFLQSILARDRIGITRLARALDVTEHTVYRWMNGTSIPQQAYLKRLPNVLPEHRNTLIQIIEQIFPGLLEAETIDHCEIQKDIYQRLVNIVASNDEEDLRLWYAIQALFDNILLQFDPDFHGLAVTYAKLSSVRADGNIHSLRESEMRGHAPWPPCMTTARAFLGSTSLAGRAAMLQRRQVWHGEPDGRIPVQIDEFERSACATPLIRGRTIAGVLLVSSVHPEFFADIKKCDIIDEYARLLTIAIPPGDFQSIYRLKLHRMPSLEWQQARLHEVYIDDVLKYVTLYNLSRAEAELLVERDLEKEFEEQSGQEGQ